MRFNIKVRLCELRLTSRKLVGMLNERGVEVTENYFSQAILGIVRGERADRICEAADKLLCELEAARKEA